jgi:hypothetical protein
MCFSCPNSFFPSYGFEGAHSPESDNSNEDESMAGGSTFKPNFDNLSFEIDKRAVSRLSQKGKKIELSLLDEQIVQKVKKDLENYH